MTKPLRARRRQKWTGELSDDAIAWLHGENDAWPFFGHDAPEWSKIPDLYAEHSAALIAEHIVERPGTRPRLWWRHIAPEPRRRLGGVGELRGYESLQSGMPYGIPEPSKWRWPGTIEYDLRVQRVAADPLAPPRFESQASFLKRHRLFLRGEAARLTPDDFELEAVFPK